MGKSLLQTPTIDPTPLFEMFRGNYCTELLTAAIGQFDLFSKLNDQPQTLDQLAERLGLASRPANVLITALRAMKLLERDAQGRLQLAPIAREHLVPGGPFDVSGYIGLAMSTPGVQEMIVRLTTNRPAGSKPEEEGAAFIYRDGLESAMEKEATARHFTMALAGRAKNVAPHLAANVPLAGAKVLVDAGGGTGLYSIACLQQHPALRAIVWDRPEVLKVAAEMASEYGVGQRLELRPGNMFGDEPPAADVFLLSNILHDWDVPECRQLVARCAGALPAGGRVLIHDVYLNDALDGPLPIALYSAALFGFTEGRAYSAAEYRSWLADAGLKPADEIIPTYAQCGVLVGTK